MCCALHLTTALRLFFLAAHPCSQNFSRVLSAGQAVSKVEDLDGSLLAHLIESHKEELKIRRMNEVA
jgi:hypothetical protein